MEAYGLFEGLVGKINREVASYLMDGQLMIQADRAPQEAKERKTDLSRVSTNRAAEEEQNRRRAAMQSAGEPQKVETIRRVDKKIGRNDPCPCGSGKKYKQCHGANA
jgi:preprotein translocase subunit SecA